MKNSTKVILHVLAVSVIAFSIFGLPIILNIKNINTSADINAGATVPLPDIPSGEFLICMKTSAHKDTLADWEAFFLNDEEHIVVIFEDIECSIANGDNSAIELAKRYQAYLPVNQMKLKYENATLLVSKVEQGYLDVAIFSKDMADYLKLKEASLLNDVTIFSYKENET